MIMLCRKLFGWRNKDKKATVTNKKIPIEDITEFYHTYENINFNAFYQRNRFYKKDDKFMFCHETREKPGEYGPTTEKDITSVGTFELSADDWNNFSEFLKDGTVSARKDSAETGSSGPWTFIYWKNDKGKYQVFQFPSYDTRQRFEEFCSALTRVER